MAYDNNGILSKNRKKEKENHPDITGSATVNGVDYWLSGWSKTGKNGPFYSLSFKPKDQKGESSSGPSTGAARSEPAIDPDDDSIPF